MKKEAQKMFPAVNMKSAKNLHLLPLPLNLLR
jgi:hypothetical protein